MVTARKKLLILIIIVLAIGGFFLVVKFSFPQNPPNPQNSPVAHYYIGNLHTHTFASDGRMSYDEAINEAVRLGFNFIAITDHNTISTDVKNLCPAETRILCIIGEEVSTTEGHVLAIDIKQVIPKDLTPEEAIEEIHKQGGLAIPAHPAASNGLSINKIKELAVDAVECSIRHKTGDTERYDCESLPNIPHIYNSDAHNKKDLAKEATKCLFSSLSIENLKEAIKTRRCFEF